MEKKKKKLTLESWLENQSPGQYVIVDKLINLDPKNLYYKKSSAILGLKKDPDVQIKVEYFKDQADLGLIISTIKEEFRVAENDMIIAREIASTLSKEGVNKISVGVITPAIYFIPFGEPNPESRQTYLKSILSLLEKRNDPERKSIFIEFLEDSLNGKEFKDVVPNGYWYREDSFHERHKTVTLDFEWEPSINFDSLNRRWKVNVVSHKSSDYLEDAHQQAMTWAEKNIDKPFYLEGEQAIHYEIDGVDPMAIRYAFPYFKEKINPDDPEFETKVKGYVTGIYKVDEKKYTNVKTVIEE